MKLNVEFFKNLYHFVSKSHTLNITPRITTISIQEKKVSCTCNDNISETISMYKAYMSSP